MLSLGLLIHVQPPQSLTKPSLFPGPIPLLLIGAHIFYNRAFVCCLLFLVVMIFIRMVTTV